MKAPIAVLASLLFLVGCADAPSEVSTSDSLSEPDPVVTVDSLPPDTLIAASALTAEEAASKALGEGDRAPAFNLLGADGGRVNMDELLAKGPVVLTFYRGAWCPYCNTELRLLQAALPEIENAGASLVAVSPQTPDGSMTMRDKQDLKFPVLSDPGNEVARQYGLVFAVGEEVAERYRLSGIDLAAINGDNSFELPIPATYVIGTDGVIRYAFVDADYRVRAAPDAVVSALRAL